MERINLQLFSHKIEAEKECEKNNTTIKEVVLDNIYDIIEALHNIANKIENNEKTENEDWTEAAVPLNNIMNAVSNGWYIN